MKRVLVVSGSLLVAAYVLGGPLGCAPSDEGGISGGSGGSRGSGGTSGGSGGAGSGQTGGTTGSGGSSDGSGGSGPTGSGGQSVGSGGSGSGGAVGSGGSGNGTGGSGSGGTGAGGRGTGGSGSGGAGSGGTTGTGGTGTTNLMDVARPINGVLITAPCVRDVAASVCDTVPQGGNCPDGNVADLPLRGIKTYDKTFTLAGQRGTMYRISLHVQGEVEAKQYTGGMDQDNAKASPATDGFYQPMSGDTARVVTSTYNVYLLRVTNPAGAKVDYFLNAIQPPGVQNHTTYGMDYMATITAEGGSTVRLVSSDSNCQMIKNCGPTQNNGSVCPGPITIQPEADVRTANPTVDFTRAYNGQWIGLTVKSVTMM